MFESICSYPLTADLFAQAIHPSEPLVSVGLATGHVETFRLPSDDLSQSQNGGDDADDDDDDDTGSVLSKSSVLSNTTPTGTIERVWRTRRHKGSCRSLAYSVDGALLYSAGTDGLVKVAAADTGRVTAKIVVPFAAASSDGSARVGAAPAVDAPTVIHALSPQSLILATDSGAMYVYDLRDPLIASPSAGAGASSSSSSSPACLSARPQQTHHPHDDYVSSLTPLPPSAASTSGFSKQWITTGGTTVALTDLRRGVLVRSEDQEEELVSSCYVTGLRRGGTSQGEKLLVGGSGGVLTLWEKGAWDDQD
ncbi:WD repeat-containing protein jip5 [Ascosphaera acerosa]|nr:WD repeat-containing protein jip5 [Ascosphaera acerosa]